MISAARCLISVPGYIVPRPGIWRLGGQPDTVADLKDHDLVGYVEDLVYTPDLNYTVDVLKGWRSTAEVATAVGQVEAVRSGVGIGILHDFMAAEQSGLVHILPQVRVTRGYWTVWHENLGSARRVQAVVEFLDRTARRARTVNPALKPSSSQRWGE